MTGYVLDLADIRIGDAGRVGPKVARLAEMAATAGPPGGWRVPDGYAITADALRSLPRQSGSVPPWLRDAVAAAHERLAERTGRGAGLRVAVRSSAVTEDGDRASFAGQYATYLGLTGIAEVCERIRDCLASVSAGRAEAYRRDRRPGDEPADLAVGVFELVDARSAGVVFTMDPVTGDRGRMVVEANWGFGESVVSGAVTPDHWEVDAAAGVITATSVGAKRHCSRLDPGADRVILTELTPDQAAEPSLSGEEVRRLCRLAASIAESEGVPQDVEWAIAHDGTVFLLQHRPETTWRATHESFNPVQYALRNVFKVPGT